MLSSMLCVVCTVRGVVADALLLESNHLHKTQLFVNYEKHCRASMHCLKTPSQLPI